MRSMQGRTSVALRRGWVFRQRREVTSASPAVPPSRRPRRHLARSTTLSKIDRNRSEAPAVCAEIHGTGSRAAALAGYVERLESLLLPGCQMRFGEGGHISVGETRSTPDTQVPDGRTDIPIYVLGIIEACDDHGPHAIIECKRVAGSDAKLCREYVCNGIDRFVVGNYGGRHAAGFMAEYLESGNADDAVRGINRYLTKKGRHDELLGPAKGFRADWARSSRHSRSTGIIPVDLHHAFLVFT